MLRDALFIARKDIRYTIRERITVLWLFVMPVIFFFFIGTTIQDAPGSSSASVKLAVGQPAGQDLLAARLLQRLAQNGFEVVASGDAESVAPKRSLALPPDLTAAVLGGEAVTLEYTGDTDNPAHQFETIRATRAVYTVLADVAILTADPQLAPGGVTAQGFAALDALPRELTLSVRAAGRRVEIPSGFEQAVPGIMVMFTMLVLLTSGAITLLVEREKRVLLRLASTPVRRSEIVLGKWGGKMALGLLQIGFAMLAGTLLFGMRWGDDLPMIFVLLFSWAAFCASLGLLLGSVGRTEGQVAGLGVFATMMLAALGGCWWPIEVAPPWMQTVQKLIPSGWAMDGLHKLISFGAGAASVIPNVVALLVGSLFCGWLARRYFRYQ